MMTRLLNWDLDTVRDEHVVTYSMSQQTSNTPQFLQNDNK